MLPRVEESLGEAERELRRGRLNPNRLREIPVEVTRWGGVAYDSAVLLRALHIDESVELGPPRDEAAQRPHRRTDRTRLAPPGLVAAALIVSLARRLRGEADPEVRRRIELALRHRGQQLRRVQQYRDREAKGRHAGRTAALAKYEADHQQQSIAGGRAGAGRPKRPHTDLIRRVVCALIEHGQAASAANVRLLLKSGWEKLVREFDDPLPDIVDVQVRAQGPVVIEYTARWAAAHHGKRFVALDADALGRVLKRWKTK